MRPYPRFRALRAAVLVCAAATCWLVVTANGAAAHAELLRSEPSQGARLDQAPDQVVLVFTEAVTPVSGGMRVLDGRGQLVAEPTAHHVATPAQCPGGRDRPCATAGEGRR